MPCMNRSLICTGSRRVVPVPGLSSMRTPISVGPSAVKRLLDQPLKIVFIRGPGAVGKAAGDSDGHEVSQRRGRRRLRAGDLVDAVVHDDHDEVFRRQRRDRRRARRAASTASRRLRAPNTRRFGCASATPSAIGKASPMLPSMYQFCGRWPAAHRSKLVLPIPPITASSFFSFATRRCVRSKRFITLVLRAGVLAVMGALTCQKPCRRSAAARGSAPPAPGW